MLINENDLLCEDISNFSNFLKFSLFMDARAHLFSFIFTGDNTLMFQVGTWNISNF